MATNTGQKVYQWLKQLNLTTGLPTGVRKPNDPADPDYVPPVTDLVACPLPVAPTFSWVEDTYTCQQEELFGLVATYGGFSSPFGIAWDTLTGRYYVVDCDDVNGNFYWFNPDTITGYGSVTHLSGSTSDINVFVVDKENRRIIAAGDESGGAKVLDMAAATVSSLPYGTDAVAGTGRRTPMALSDSYLYAFCSLPNVLRRYNRSTLAFVDEINKSSIPSNGTYLVNGYSVNFIGSEIWVGATSRSAPEIARYSSDFLTLLGTIPLPGATVPGSPWTAASRYWQTHFYDAGNNRYYVSDIGSRKIFVINTLTGAIINSYVINNMRGKHFIDTGFSKSDLDGKIYASVRGTDNLSDPTSNFKLYIINPTTGGIENIYPDASAGHLTTRSGTTQQWGTVTGSVSWTGGSWQTDGLIQKYQ